MKKAQALAALLGMLVCLPIWFYLIYQVMVRVNASELMWFLFWVYVPATVIVQSIAKYFAAGEK